MNVMDFRMNFNQSVKVKLTDFGEQILRNRHEEWNLHYLERGGKDNGPYVSKADSEGYTSFQIWELIQKFGRICRLLNLNHLREK
ncbi:hypothetical protein [Paenibacillus sp. FSL L8-0708]|uniref:hypothetical protein n=1 Tax=Paenibacillus sp. FSL L8-0708 TaxID=2975311 RepID=UPI0030FBAAA3